MKTALRLALVAGLLALPTVALAAAGVSRVLVPDCAQAVYMPKRIVLACGDGSNQLTKLSWTGWSTRTAHGSGVDEANDCTPNCVSGHFHGYPATVTLTQPRRCARVKHHRVFARIVLQYTGAHPGNSSTMTAALACPF